MNSLLKNVAGQLISFRLTNRTADTPVLGGAPTALVGQNNGAPAAGGGAFTEKGDGVYTYSPTQAETNADVVLFIFNVAGGGALGDWAEFRTEPAVTPDTVLAVVQPHYAPAKAGDAMALVANQDVRTVLGNLAGNVQGDVLGTVPSPVILSDGAVNAILDEPNGVQVGLTLRLAMRQLIAALVNITPSFDFSAHTGPTGIGLKPKFTGKVRTMLGIAEQDLSRLLEFNQASPEVGLFSPALATALGQLRTALDAVRTSVA